MHDSATGERLALKRLPPNPSSWVQALFETEYQTLASLQHQHTVQVYDYGGDPSGAFYTMELLAGENLKQCAPMTWRQVCHALRDATLALEVLHARRLVHRDVSPRNLWRTPDGRVKLIDFGALSSFGRIQYVVGTPPFIAPEVLRDGRVDQRTDLYALGATGYYLLSGKHAFPARDLSELPELWGNPPPPPSAALANRAHAGADQVPGELDALLMSLLRDNPMARPSSTAEVVDRLETLLGTAPRPRDEHAPLHFQNAAFSGRANELRPLRRQLALANGGKGQSAIVEDDAGMGRTRLLHELGLAARVSGAIVLHVDAASYPEPYGPASALALKLLDVIPGLAQRMTADQIGALAHVSRGLAQRLNLVADQPPEIAGELRVRMQAALRDLVASAAGERTLVVLVDGLEQLDEGTSAFLLALARARHRTRLLLVCSLLRDARRAESAIEQALRKTSRVLRLTPLTEAATFEMLRSIFGPAEHLTRLVNHLHTLSAGNPGHTLELLAQLVRSDVVVFNNGAWVLPQVLPESELPPDRNAALLSRLDLLSYDARELARVLSVTTGAIAFDLCHALTQRPAARLATLLEELCRHEIMTRDEDGLRFAHLMFRDRLVTELEPERRSSALRALGEYLLRAPNPSALVRLQAGVHLLRSGELRGIPIITRASTEITLREPDRLAPAASVLEQALALFRAHKRPLREQMAVLAPLAIAGYFVDRRFAVAYGEAAIETLHSAMGLGLALRLRPWLGRLLSLLVALTIVSLRYAIRPRDAPAPKLPDALILLFMTAASLAASSALVYDYDGTRRAAQLLEPFGVLGPRFAPGFTYEVCCGLATAVRDTVGESYARWERFIRLLESKQPIIGLPANLRVRYLTGLLYATGIFDSQRDSDWSLRTADRLDAMGIALYPMSTDQLRATFYAHQGDAKRFAHFRERSEQRAIQQGAIWQNEAWALLMQTVVSHRHHDALGAKRVAAQLQSASQHVPSLGAFADRSRGTYLLMRGRPEQALPWLERCLSEPLRMNFGWGRCHAVLARAYNDLGRHERARAACQRVLAEFDAGDLSFPGLALPLETELLVAEAGLGETASARSGLAKLLAAHGPNLGRLTLGELHETGVRIALLAHDETAANEHCALMAEAYGGTHIPTLIQHCEAVAARISKTFHPELLAPPTNFPSLPANSTLGSQLRSRTLDESTRHALTLLGDATFSSRADLFALLQDGSLCRQAQLASHTLEPKAEQWLQTRVQTMLAEDTTTTLPGAPAARERDTRADPDVFEAGGWHYRVVLLTHGAPTTAHQGIVALLAADGAAPSPCPASLRVALGQQLNRLLSPSTTTSPTTTSSSTVRTRA